MLKNKNKIQWKLLAVDYATPFVQGVSYMLGLTTPKFKKIVQVKKTTPSLFEVIEEKINKQKFRWGLIEKDYVGQARNVIDKLDKDSKFFDRTNKESRITVKRVQDYVLWLFKQDLSQYSDKKLVDVYSKLFHLMVDMNIWGHVVNLVDFDHNMLTNKIIDFLEKRIKDVGYKLSVPEVFGILTTPLEKSPVMEQEEDFYKLLLQIQKDEKSIDKAAEERKQKYDWLEFHYSGPTILEKEYFVELFRSEIKQGVNSKEKLKEFEEKRKQLALNQKRISNELNLSKKELYWINIAKTFMFLKAIRKDMVFQMSRFSDPLIREIGKRLRLTSTQVRYLTVEEVKKALLSKKLDVDLIKKRVKYSVWIIDNGKIKVLTDKKAKEYSKLIIEEKAEEQVSELKGTPACIGKVKGVVKIIIGADDMSKMNKGDVLVSPATNPNLLSAMKKAVAIVTDEGGITCHAAIVSRELKIPCIIGTKIATKALKDGDKVEVDADKGVVRIINKK